MTARALAAIGLAALCACAPATEVPRDAVRVVRESVVPGNTFASLDRTIGAPDAAAIRAELVALRPKTVDKFCPIDFGLRYRLSFGGSPGLVAVLEAGGCRYAYLSSTDIRETTEEFWAHLASVLGYDTRGHDLFPTPLPRESPGRP